MPETGTLIYLQGPWGSGTTSRIPENFAEDYRSYPVLPGKTPLRDRREPAAPAQILPDGGGIPRFGKPVYIPREDSETSTNLGFPGIFGQGIRTEPQPLTELHCFSDIEI